MKPSDALRYHQDDIRRVVEQNRACNPRVFGSVLRGVDREGSDLDLLVEPMAETSLLDIARIQRCLQQLLGVPVDVLTPRAIPERFRDRVLAEAAPL